MTRVLLAEPHAMLQQGIAAILADPPEGAGSPVELVATVDGLSDLRRLLAEADLDVVLADEDLPGGDVLRFVRSLSEHHPDVRVVILSGDPSDARMLAFFRAGAAGYVSKRSNPSFVYHAVLAASAGGTFIDPALANRLVTLAARGSRVRGPYGLTVQEIRVLGLLADEFTNREIGERLGISPETVKTHLSNALGKIGARDRVEGAAIVRREGLG